ncbi:hypothetical protein DPMN_150057 [Dreissena polymorpha]|uniref:Uncharacterized protein n=1 Tax=Dreissena polymorpha TaxID=45954 RepID=A0A9D4J5A5_DREPO|nr:hypothetical protein DPMN_150057 [Dreissena polymorpha]
MEVLEPAKTMDSILKAVKEEVKKKTRYSKQVKLFSLCFLKKALEGIRVLHNQRWVHTDSRWKLHVEERHDCQIYRLRPSPQTDGE